jgi:hypothetical protein
MEPEGSLPFRKNLPSLSQSCNAYVNFHKKLYRYGLQTQRKEVRATIMC